MSFIGPFRKDISQFGRYIGQTGCFIGPKQKKGAFRKWNASFSLSVISEHGVVKA